MERAFDFLGNEAVAVVGLAVAVGLALYWFLRGAPIGQSADLEGGEGLPTPRYRDLMAGATVIGVLGVLLGAYAALRFGVAWSIPAFAIGFGVLLLTIRSNRRYRHASPSLRRMAGFADALMTGALLAGVLIVANVLAFTYGDRPIDLSLDRSYSLESMTIGVLKDLDEPVTLTVFFGRGGQAQGQFERVRRLITLMEAENPERIEVEYLDPYRNPERARTLDEEVPGLSMTQGGGVLVTFGEGDDRRRIIVRNLDIFAMDFAGAEAASGAVAETQFLGESAVLNALIRLKQGEQPIVAVTTGHGEPGIDRNDPSRPGLGQLRARLEGVGMKVVAFNPAGQVPEGASAVIVAAPEETMGPEVVARLRGYSENDGRLLLILGNRQPSGMEGWLDEMGVGLGLGLVVDPSLYVGQPRNPRVPIQGGAEDHPIVEPLAGRTVLMPSSAPIDAKIGPKAPSGLLVMPLLRTGRTSFVETSPDRGTPRRDAEGDIPGPIVVAAAVADRPRPGDPDGEADPRLVLFSSPLMADNQTVSATGFANLDLVVNALGWLGERPDLQGVAPRTYVARVLKASPNMRAKLVILPTVMAASILIGLGVATHLSRRE